MNITRKIVIGPGSNDDRMDQTLSENLTVSILKLITNIREDNCMLNSIMINQRFDPCLM